VNRLACCVSAAIVDRGGSHAGHAGVTASTGARTAW